MEYTIEAFVDRLRTLMYDNMPVESNEMLRAKHSKRGNRHFRDFAFMDLPITIGENSRTFDLGSAMAEAITPQYHILQQAEVIHRPYKGTVKSKGSQANESNLLMRDYNKITWNGKTFSKEYEKNVRGERSKARKITEPKLRYIKGQYYEERNTADYYLNVHYKYIDRILDAIVPYLASEFGLTPMRKQDTGLEEDYNLQITEDIINTLFSFDY